MRTLLLPLVALLPLLAGGCLVKTAANVATMPVKAGAKAVDWTTTSQDEADRNRGREMRKREKECRKHPERCQNEQR
jgi:hypothetical protein